MPAPFAVPWSLLLALTPVPQAQDRAADPPVASYRVGEGQGAVVLRSELARELALRARRTPQGQEALSGLVDLHVIDRAARDAGLTVSAAVLAAKLEEIDAGLRAQGDSLDAYVARLGIDRTTFEQRFVRAGILQEELVMRSLGSTDRNEVTSELTKLWQHEMRTRLKVETDESKLPDGVVAFVAAEPIRLEELGQTLLPITGADAIAKHVRRIVLRDLVRREAERLGVRVTEEDARAEIALRKARIENDPRYRGVDYAAWLRETQGLTIDEFARSPMLIATVEQRKISEKLHSAAMLREELERDRVAVLRRHGEKRTLAAIVLRTSDTPNELVKFTPAQAAERLAALREQADTRRPFADLARVHSEDPLSKVRGGELGEFARADTELPESVLAIAFELPLGGISAPLPIEGGMAIVKVTAIAPPPSESELLERLRDEHAERWLAGLLESAQLEMQE
ncbi:MAG: peptidylprolyl isomerase [Planctomycetes bacterium]|nr:peptidylprolyl isomerase [Planctomycetota bacterium]